MLLSRIILSVLANLVLELFAFCAWHALFSAIAFHFSFLFYALTKHSICSNSFTLVISSTTNALAMLLM